MGGQALADRERTWQDRHWQTGRGRGWTDNGSPVFRYCTVGRE